MDSRFDSAGGVCEAGTDRAAGRRRGREHAYCGVGRVQLAGSTIEDIAFEGNGCAISQASASLMTMALKGLAQDEALALFTRVHTMLTTKSDDDAPPPGVGKLAVLSGVWEYPMRVKCATLAWQALRSALEDAGSQDETE